MITGRRGALAILLIPFIVSCASGGSGGSSDLDGFSIRYRSNARGYKYTFDAPTDRIVASLPEVYRLLGFPGGLVSDPDGLVFASPSATAEGRIYAEEPNSQYLDCGAAIGARQRADTHIVEFVLVTRIEPLETGGSEIEVIVDGRARERTHNMNAVPCEGTGKFEGQIADLLRAQLRG